jgi:hypothetical protein
MGDAQNCIDCRWIWTGNQRCVECTDRIIKRREDEWRAKLFVDFKPRGRMAPS